MTIERDIGVIARQFDIRGEFASATDYGSGHINDTYCVLVEQMARPGLFILQRINHHIFKNPIALVENIERVTAHLSVKLADAPDHERRRLTLIPTRDGLAWYADAGGDYWRMYRFIERARSYDSVASAEQAFQAARAFGQFQQMLVDLPGPRLHETIPDFHNTPLRMKVLEAAVHTDAAGRAKAAAAEIDFAMAHRGIARLLIDAGLPERVTHNDTKLNNVLIDDATGDGICVIDFDTVMPGLAPYDFGDMVRTATCPAAEDERDLQKVVLQFPMFEALLRGYLSTAGAFLTRDEKRSLVAAGKLLAFEQGVRFLTDCLNGDTYYKVAREGHNLDRCRTQFKLLESIHEQEDQMNRLVESLL